MQTSLLLHSITAYCKTNRIRVSLSLLRKLYSLSISSLALLFIAIPYFKDTVDFILSCKLSPSINNSGKLFSNLNSSSSLKVPGTGNSNLAEISSKSASKENLVLLVKLLLANEVKVSLKSSTVVILCKVYIIGLCAIDAIKKHGFRSLSVYSQTSENTIASL